MKNLNLPEIPPEYIDQYISVRNSKQLDTRKKLIELHQLMMDRYLAHSTAVHAKKLENLARNPAAIANSALLRSCYSGSTKPLRNMKKATFDRQAPRLLKYCPMCGITMPGTFDHYLPAVLFPEFSVHPLNLIPCCARCNSTKDDDWLSAVGSRQYLNAYFDLIPDVQFVSVELHSAPSLTGVGATFSLIEPEEIATSMWNLIRSHFKKLKLIDRYDEHGNAEIAEVLADVRIYLESGGPRAGEFLLERARDRRATYGRNHWIAVLMEALAVDPRLSEWTTG